MVIIQFNSVYLYSPISQITNLQGSYGHGKPGKAMGFENGHLQAWKSHGKNLNHKSHGNEL